LSRDWYWQQDEHFRFTWISRDPSGPPMSDKLGKTPWAAWRADPDEPPWRGHREALRRHEPFQDFEISFVHDDGTAEWRAISGVPRFDADGRFLGYQGVTRVITAEMAARRDLKQNEERFRDFARASGDWLTETDAEGRYTWIWDYDESRRGVPAQWFIGRRRVDLAPPGTDFDAEPWKSHLETLERREPFRDFRYTIHDPGEFAVISVSGIPIFDAAGRFLGYRNLARDVTEQVRLEHAARSADEKLRAAVENLHEAIVLCDAENRIVLTNRAFRETHRDVAEYLQPGRQYDEWLRASVSLGKYPEAAGREEAWLEERLDNRLESSGSFEVQHGQSWFLVKHARLPDGGTISYGLDITELRRDQEERLSSERRHRDTLIREVHHRIKNNLQGVVGLLRWELHGHPEAGPALQRAAAQVQAIALVHGLHGKNDAGSLKICEIIPAIARDVRALTQASIAVTLDVTEQGVRLAENESVAVALIINELLLNAVKHSADRAGVRVDLRQIGEAGTLTVRHPGTLPPGFEFAAGRGIGTGLELVRALIPPAGVRLSIAQDAGEVVTTLELSAPVVIGP